MNTYITKLENIAMPLCDAVLDNIKFYFIKNEDTRSSGLIASFMSVAEINLLVDEYAIYEPNWIVDGLISWAYKNKNIKLTKIVIRTVKR